jgi:hypothetical protein
MPDAGPRIVEWYRVDPWPRMRPFVVIGPALLTLGGLVVAVSFVTHQRADVRLAATVIGFVLVGGAALVTMVGMSRLLREDAYLAVRTDGVALRVEALDLVVPWGELAAVRWDAATAELVLERTRGEGGVRGEGGEGADEVRTACRFARISGKELAERIGRARLRIALKLPT